MSDAEATPTSNAVKTLESVDDVENAIKGDKPSVLLINTPGVSSITSLAAAKLDADLLRPRCVCRWNRLGLDHLRCVLAREHLIGGVADPLCDRRIQHYRFSSPEGRLLLRRRRGPQGTSSRSPPYEPECVADIALFATWQDIAEKYEATAFPTASPATNAIYVRCPMLMRRGRDRAGLGLQGRQSSSSRKGTYRRRLAFGPSFPVSALLSR